MPSRDADAAHEQGNHLVDDVKTQDLYLSFHGRIIEHLGIQMYQSPVAAVAELVSNGWDADAKRVSNDHPPTLNHGAVVTI